MPAFQLTLTDADTNYEAIQLVRAIKPTLVDGFSHMVIQADADNLSGVVRVARDENISDTRFGYRLGAGEGQTYPSGWGNQHFLRGLYFRGNGAGLKVNIDLER